MRLPPECLFVPFLSLPECCDVAAPHSAHISCFALFLAFILERCSASGGCGNFAAAAVAGGGLGFGVVRMSGAELLVLQDVTLGYERHPAVHHVSGVVRQGSLTALFGPNGAGKSTLLKGMMGLLRPLSGRIVTRGLDRHDIAYLPQQADIDRDFPITVLDAVMLGHWRRVGAFRGLSKAMREQARHCLADVGLAGFEDRPLGALSVGQRQRVLFARVMVADSPVIVLDEPFNAIDARTTADLLDLVLRWHEEGRTVLAVLHDMDQVWQHFPETLLLARELVAWGPTEAVLTKENLQKARAMSDVWDRDAPYCEGIAAS